MNLKHHACSCEISGCQKVEWDVTVLKHVMGMHMRRSSQRISVGCKVVNLVVNIGVSDGSRMCSKKIMQIPPQKPTLRPINVLQLFRLTSDLLFFGIPPNRFNYKRNSGACCTTGEIDCVQI